MADVWQERPALPPALPPDGQSPAHRRLGVRGRPPSARTHAIGRPLPCTHTASHPRKCIHAHRHHTHMRVAADAAGAALDIGIMLRSDARDRNTEWKP